ncbi:hypothetical protein EZS27_043209, partial [termite gut metagenome]
MPNRGFSQRARVLINPLFSPIFMMPSHRARTPVNHKDMSKAFFDELNVELIISVNISVSPKHTNFIIATAKAMRKKA